MHWGQLSSHDKQRKVQREHSWSLYIAKAIAVIVGTGEASLCFSTAPLWIRHDFHHPHSRMRKLRLKEVTSAA